MDKTTHPVYVCIMLDGLMVVWARPAMTLWWTGVLLAFGSVVAIIAATRTSGLLLILAIIVACSSCCGAGVRGCRQRRRRAVDVMGADP